jgi:putative membrane-bound dehydrogenase-like protein
MKFLSLGHLSIALLFALSLAACRNQSVTKTGAGPQAQSAQNELKTFQLSEDFKAELFLNEPQVMSPTEMAWDEFGKLYVAEMLDYPEDPPPGTPARSKIRLLEDKDGDGSYESATVFADHVLEVSGLHPWKGGLLVTAAPDILWMKDNDGDGKADVRKVLYTGFPLVNPEARITNLRYGLDNWFYGAQNGNDGKITAPDHPEREPLLIRGADFRFNMIKDAAEATSGPAQFGSSFDDFGNQFITQNTTHLRHVILPMSYIRRAPLLEVPAFAYDISDHGKPSSPIYPLTEPQEWRKQRTALRQQRYDENGLNRVEQLGGYFSGASGGTVYNGDNFPAEYANNVFTGDVSANLIHRDIIQPDGVTFKASRSKDGVEFLGSTDVWFRPCNFANAPDGNLYVMDIYRLFIETPESIPEEIKKGMDFYAGDKLGRIWRLVPNQPRVQRGLKVNLGAASVPELVKTLEHPNGWHRFTAQRLIVERQEKAAIPNLKELAEKSATPQGRLHALWTLEGLSALDDTSVLEALQARDAHVREHALRLAERFLPQSKVLAGAVLARAKDTDLRVQFQAAFTLGQLKDVRSLNALADLALQHSSDQWFRLAILSSAAESASQFYALLRSKKPDWESPEMFTQLAALIGAKHDAGELTRFLASLGKLQKPDVALAGLAKGIKLAGVKNLQVPQAETLLTPFLTNPNDKVQAAAWDLARYFELRALVAKATTDATNTALPVSKRVIAVRALRGGQFAAVQPMLAKLIVAHDTPDVQSAAIESLAAFDDQNIAPLLLANWKSYLPDARQKVLNALLTNQDWMRTLLKAAEDEQVERTAFDPAARARLVDHPDKAISERAQTFFKEELSDRAQIASAYLDAAKLEGDVARGKQYFEENCAKCHLPQREKARIGADLSGINNKTKEELITSILNPSKSIEPRFVNYIVTAKDGHIYDGVLGNETPGSITLRGGGEGDITILRTNIADIRASAISLMPDGFEKKLDKQAIADILAYLRGGL